MTSGFGKVILLGEHAVVYGHPALAGAIDRRVTAVAVRAAGPLRVRAPQWSLDCLADDDVPVGRAVRAIAAHLAIERGFDLDVDTDLPPGAGLGSSAAFAVAVTRALAAAVDRDLDDRQVAAIADAAERVFHANPSGVDVALATRGGMGLFRRDDGLEPVDLPPCQLAVGLSGEPRSTAHMVTRVADAHRADPEGVGAMLTELGDASLAGATALRARDAHTFGLLMNRAHELLAALGVSTPALDALCEIAHAAGATGAKLTGGGGGGAVIAMGADEPATAEIVRGWRTRGFEAFSCLVGVRHD